MTPNEILHKAMGLCWHSTTKVWNGAGNPFNHCVLCLADFHGSVYNNPDYSQPEHIGKVYAWMALNNHKRLMPRWCLFEVWFRAQKKLEMVSFLRFSFELQVKTIAEWITDEEKS